jgi:type II secretory pathway predicted ATPase ExeA
VHADAFAATGAIRQDTAVARIRVAGTGVAGVGVAGVGRAAIAPADQALRWLLRNRSSPTRSPNKYDTLPLRGNTGTGAIASVLLKPSMTPIRSVLWSPGRRGVAHSACSCVAIRATVNASPFVSLRTRLHQMTLSRIDEFFGFSHRPFRATPDPQDYVPLASVEEEIERLASAAALGDGVSVLTAPPGAGKTIVCDRLRHELSHDFHAAVLSSSGFASRRSLLQAVLFELRQPYENLTEQELRLSILNFARGLGEHREAIVLVVDEAHLLNVRLLEELRCLTNHSRGGRPLIRVVLCGQLALEESLVQPELQALNYRIACHSTLEPLSQRESAELVAGRLLHAGRTAAAIFTPDALETICRVSDGNPRCLMQLCDHALELAADRSEPTVEIRTVRRALQDLKQLPLQWNESATDSVSPVGSDGLDRSDDVTLDPAGGISSNGRSESGDVSSGLDPCRGWKSPVAAVEVGSGSGPVAAEGPGSRPSRSHDVELQETAETAGHSSLSAFDSMEDSRDVYDEIEDPDGDMSLPGFAGGREPAEIDVEIAPWDSDESFLEENHHPVVAGDSLMSEDSIGFTTTSRERSFQIISCDCSSEWVETGVEDLYAALDRTHFASQELQSQDELTSMLCSTVSRSDTSIDVEARVSQDRRSAVEGDRFRKDPDEQIDQIMSALSAMTEDFQQEFRIDHPSRTRRDADPTVSRPGGSFDVVEPSLDRHVSDGPLPPDVPTGAGRVCDMGSSSGTALPRPYARLFSRIRRCGQE